MTEEQQDMAAATPPELERKPVGGAGRSIWTS